MKNRKLLNVLFVIPDCELQVTRDNTLLLVITSSIASKLKNFRSQVLEYSGKIDCERISQNADKLRGTNEPGAPAPTRCA